MPNVSDHTLRKATVTFTVTTGKIRYSQRLMYPLSVFQMYPIDRKIQYWKYKLQEVENYLNPEEFVARTESSVRPSPCYTEPGIRLIKSVD